MCFVYLILIYCRCILHQCECVDVARKQRAPKRSKIGVERVSFLVFWCFGVVLLCCGVVSVVLLCRVVVVVVLL